MITRKEHRKDAANGVDSASLSALVEIQAPHTMAKGTADSNTHMSGIWIFAALFEGEGLSVWKRAEKRITFSQTTPPLQKNQEFIAWNEAHWKETELRAGAEAEILRENLREEDGETRLEQSLSLRGEENPKKRCTHATDCWGWGWPKDKTRHSFRLELAGRNDKPKIRVGGMCRSPHRTRLQA